MATPASLVPAGGVVAGVRPVVAVPDQLAQAGCPIPPGRGRVPAALVPGTLIDPNIPGSPAHGVTVVAEDLLPVPGEPPPTDRRKASVERLGGIGMWTWKWKRTEGGDAARVVARAKAAGITSIWVRVGDSRDGFYGGPVLEQLVAKAHAAGVQVVGWGFPFLGDPASDAAWTRAALEWHGTGGVTIDAFSPDLETASEGVFVTERRLRTYLEGVRPALGGRPLVATVYPPTDHWWKTYPYGAVAPYVDAWAPMLYWGCKDPGAVVDQAIARLGASAPVLPIGQAYDQGPDGGRSGRPSAAETLRFLDHATRRGAIGTSFWLWDDAAIEQWQVIASFPWKVQPAGR